MRLLIHLLLILTFVVQPASTLADVHQFHQSGAEHLGFENHRQTGDHLIPNAVDTNTVDPTTTDTTTTDTTTDTTKSSGTQFDCHHCCHCHGVACGIGLPVTQVLECEYGVFIQKSEYAARVYPSVHEKQFRPPRV